MKRTLAIGTLLMAGVIAVASLAGCTSKSSDAANAGTQCVSLSSVCINCDVQLCDVNNAAGMCTSAYTTATYLTTKLGTFACNSCEDIFTNCVQAATNACAGQAGFDGGTHGTQPPAEYDGGGSWLYCNTASYDSQLGVYTGFCGGTLLPGPTDAGCTGSQVVASCPTDGLVGCCTTSIDKICYYEPTALCEVITRCSGLWTPTP